MGKFKMPDTEGFLAKKRYFAPPTEPIWNILEKEMRDNIDKKPYNEKVGEWLRFLKDLKLYKRCEAKQILRNLKMAIGPPWYTELSSSQRDILKKLKDDIHQDLLEDLPVRVLSSLYHLGLALKIPAKVLMKTMAECHEDPGIFFWNLYTAIYKYPPSVLQKSYDVNAVVLMSSLVFIDLDECIERLDKHAAIVKEPPKPPKKTKNQYYQPKVRYGEYLQKASIPCYLSKKYKGPSEKAPEIKCKIRLRSAESYEKLIQDQNFIAKRIERSITSKTPERVCNYKFWEAPSCLRNTDPKMAAYVNKLKMFKLKARAKYLKYKAPFDNIQYHIGTVCYTGGKPTFQLNSIVTLPTGYIPLNGGVVLFNGEYITHIQGMWKYPREVIDKCDSDCNCLTKWEAKLLDYFEKSKCKCGHLYDLGNQGKPTENYFHPPTKYFPYWMDYAKVYQMDPTEDFILDTFMEALRSTDNTPPFTLPDVSAQSLKNSELLQSFLADLSDTPLLIPHLPKAHLLNNLKRWVGNRVKGELKPYAHVQSTIRTQRAWSQLNKINFTANSFRIPLTSKELHNLTWAHRKMLQKLMEVQQSDFVLRNRMRQVDCTRLWWPTMKYDTYPSKAFLDTFYTYMPGRLMDSFLINPYSADNVPKTSGKTCPLN